MNSLFDFLIKCTKNNKNFDFYDIKVSNSIQRLHESIENYDNTTNKIIPNNFELVKKGRVNGFICEIDKKDIKDIKKFKRELKSNDFDVTTKNTKLIIRS